MRIQGSVFNSLRFHSRLAHRETPPWDPTGVSGQAKSCPDFVTSPGNLVGECTEDYEVLLVNVQSQ